APNHALGAKRMRECGDDLDCRLDQIPPPFQPIRDKLFEIYTPPGSEEERQAKVALALELLREKPDWRTNWFNYSACEFDHLTPLFFDVWEVANEMGAYWYWPNMWQSNCGNVWDEPAFWEFVESVMLVEYWRAKGWPEACRPEGEDFVCGQAIFDESWAASG
ncbi:MAG: hypothetical protein GWM87_08640, partial [Xanthomonadales bacterium]|nr:hypothetical protein [Xanthomonadales bacterium]NIX12987.1 hypothetical protein [Xanthomonadales bacterium]